MRQLVADFCRDATSGFPRLGSQEHGFRFDADSPSRYGEEVSCAHSGEIPSPIGSLCV
jgi:hypothetical protein